MRRYLSNLWLSIASVLLCLVAAEAVVRHIDGYASTTLMLPRVLGSDAIDTSASYLDKIPVAAGVERRWFFIDPPPLPNRTAPPPEWIELDQVLQRAFANGSPFLPWYMFKAYNSVLIGDPCKNPYVAGAAGKLFVYDPPDGRPLPPYRFLPNATTPRGLVTNALGWRGPPVRFVRSPNTVRIVFVGASTVSEAHELPFSGPEYINNWLNRWAEARKLRVGFEVLNAGREAITSTQIAAIVHQEVAPVRPDLVINYEGGNSMRVDTVVKAVPKGKPMPGDPIVRWLRSAALYSDLARRAEELVAEGEWPKPPYQISWPPGVDELDPDIARPDLPANLSTVVHDLDSMRADLAEVNAEFAVSSFHWLAKDGLVLNARRHAPMLEDLNVRFFPWRYRDLERITAFENRLFAKYAAVHQLPFIDVARYMPYDPELFTDAVHNTPDGVRLRAWIMMQQLVPIIEGHLASEAWPKPIAPMDDNRPTFEVPTRMITFSCKP